MGISDLRRDYQGTALTEDQVDPDPIRQFQRWFDEAVAAGQADVNSMTLATVTPDGKPAARTMLLKGIETGQFLFYTNYQSHKADELKTQPYAALVFWWNSLERQVRVAGKVCKTSRQNSEDYFKTRPRGSQLGACASPQSRVIESRTVLDAKLAQLKKQYQDKEVPCPENWGGYQLEPDMVEFWQGLPDRLHDRLRYTRQADGSWQLQRLSP